MNESAYIDQRDGGFYVRGSRVPLDLIVREYRQGASPESIRQAYPTLTLEEVYGAVAFYLGHQSQVDATIRDAERAWSEFEAAHAVPDPIQDRLREAHPRMTGRREP